MVQPPANLRSFESLIEVIKALRGPQGCPWDKEQTHRTLTPFAIEEAHELAEAIEIGSETDMISELGDLLLQVMLHSEIGRQAGRFDIFDVIEAIGGKMVNRHPHVFANATAANSEEVLANWSEIKAKEKAAKQSAGAKTPLQARFDVPLAIPALTRAQKIGEKTKRLRFDWSEPEEVLHKVDEEIDELKIEISRRATDPSNSTESMKIKAALEHEMGDVLFSLAQLSRHLGLEAEQCLRTANSRFETRFFAMQKHIHDSGRVYDQLGTDELESAWQETKIKLKNPDSF